MTTAQLLSLSLNPILRMFRRLILSIQIDHYKRSLQSCRQTIDIELRTEGFISKRLALLESERRSVA
jgi:hypothetical protein